MAKTKTKINKDDYTYFAACICDNMPNEQIAKEFNTTYKTIVNYKSYAKAIVSGNKDLGRKIYKNLNKLIMDEIDESILMGRGAKLVYRAKSKTGPRQTGPKLRIHNKQTLEELKTKPSIKLETLKEPETKSVININTSATLKQSKSEKEEIPVKEVIGLLQSTIEAIQTLLKRF